MQTEQSNADPPIRKRRWYQFSLRTLMIVVTMFCVMIGGYVGRQAKLVRERHDAVEAYQVFVEYSASVNERPGGQTVTTRVPKAPWPLRWFGELGYSAIVVQERTCDDKEVKHLESIFPEATIVSRSSVDAKSTAKTRESRHQPMYAVGSQPMVEPITTLNHPASSDKK